MAEFQGPTDLTHNRGLIADPAAFARDAGAESWLFLCGEEFAAMEGGMSFADVHQLINQTLYAALGATRRARIHHRIG